MERGIAIALVACSRMTGFAPPLPAFDHASTSEREAGTFARYQPLNHFYDIADVVGEFEAFHFLHSLAANERRLRSQNASEIGFYASLAAGIARSSDPVIAIGVLAATSKHKAGNPE